jgi:hypothetical protein
MVVKIIIDTGLLTRQIIDLSFLVNALALKLADYTAIVFATTVQYILYVDI